MRWYILVEGRRTEKKLYVAWLAHTFPHLERVGRVEDMSHGSYFLVAGNGYPSYLSRLRNAVADIREQPARFDHLWVCIDAEEIPAPERRTEIEEILDEEGCPIDRTIVVHDCCIETWLLGNRRLIKRNPHSAFLRECYAHYDVLTRDPERLPPIAPHRPRALFHLQYLQEIFRERGLTYSKKHPSEACDRAYLRELVGRVTDTEHLRSFRYLVERWRVLGGHL